MKQFQISRDESIYVCAMQKCRLANMKNKCGNGKKKSKVKKRKEQKKNEIKQKGGKIVTRVHVAVLYVHY